MSNVVRFPGGHRVAARPIPRQEFERLAELALDVVQRIITLLDDDEEDASEAAGRSHQVRPLNSNESDVQCEVDDGCRG